MLNIGWDWQLRRSLNIVFQHRIQRFSVLKSKYLFPVETTKPPKAPEGSELRIAQNIKAHKPEKKKKKLNKTQTLRTPYSQDDSPIKALTQEHSSMGSVPAPKTSWVTFFFFKHILSDSQKAGCFWGAVVWGDTSVHQPGRAEQLQRAPTYLSNNTDYSNEGNK